MEVLDAISDDSALAAALAARRGDVPEQLCVRTEGAVYRWDGRRLLGPRRDRGTSQRSGLATGGAADVVWDERTVIKLSRGFRRRTRSLFDRLWDRPAAEEHLLQVELVNAEGSRARLAASMESRELDGLPWLELAAERTEEGDLVELLRLLRLVGASLASFEADRVSPDLGSDGAVVCRKQSASALGAILLAGLGLFIGFPLVVLLGALALLPGPSAAVRIAGWGGLLLGGLATPGLLRWLVLGRRVWIDEDGLSWAGLFMFHHVPWHEVTSVQHGEGSGAVVFALANRPALRVTAGRDLPGDALFDLTGVGSSSRRALLEKTRRFVRQYAGRRRRWPQRLALIWRAGTVLVCAAGAAIAAHQSDAIDTHLEGTRSALARGDLTTATEHVDALDSYHLARSARGCTSTFLKLELLVAQGRLDEAAELCFEFSTWKDSCHESAGAPPQMALSRLCADLSNLAKAQRRNLPDLARHIRDFSHEPWRGHLEPLSRAPKARPHEAP